MSQATAAAFWHLKPPEPIVLTELVEPDANERTARRKKKVWRATKENLHRKEDEIETTTPKTTIKISSSTSDEEELVNSMKEIKIKSKEQLYKSQQEKRMAKMEATMQLILEKLDKKERKGIYEEDKELVEETRAKKEIVQQVKEGGYQEKLE